MIGRKIRLNDYKLKFGEGIIDVNVYAAFSIDNGDKFIIYSYDNKKIYYGSYFARENNIVVMSPKENDKIIIENFINDLLNNNLEKKYHIIDLSKNNSIEIIGENIFDDKNNNIQKIFDITIPKEIKKAEQIPQKSKSLAPILTIIIIFTIITLLVILYPIYFKKNELEFVCNINYLHDKMPANVNESVILKFANNNVNSIDIIDNYVFNNSEYFNRFKTKQYYYKYMKNGDTYKFIDEALTFKLFSKVDIKNDYFLPTNRNELIKYYEDKKYTCKEVETNEK